MPRILRTRVVQPSPQKASPEPIAQKIYELMKSISKAQDAAAKQAQIAASQKSELLLLMKAGGLVQLGHDGLEAVIERSSGRSATIIDPKKFYELGIEDDDYFKACTISVTEAKKILSTKEIAAISTTKPAVPGPEQVIVRCAGSK